MALGTITVTNQEKKSASAPLDLILISFPGDGDYRTGGTLFKALLQAKLGRAVEIAFVVLSGLCGYDVIYDVANDKLICVVSTTGVEAADHANLSGVTFKLTCACY
jgi:hypothetical protein